VKKVHYLDKEERELIDSIDADEYIPVADMQDEIERITTMAKETISKKKAINIRLLESDIQKIKSKAIHEGIPYQTLISSIIHRFANGQLARV